MRSPTLMMLAAVAALVTGCPRDEYTLELTPRGAVMERELTFCRVDGTNADGSTKYCEFPTKTFNEILAVYPKGAVVSNSEVRIAKAIFTGAMPNDIGGNGNYREITTTLGTAGIYGERFRGDDDSAGQIEKRFQAADKLGELVRGWCRQEFGEEPGFKQLSQFLEEQFPRDMKNLVLYLWTGQPALSFNKKASTDAYFRMMQYLIERGYLTINDAPGLAVASSGSEEQAVVLVRRFLAKKLGLSESDPMPKPLAALGSSEALEASWNRYLGGTKEYRELVSEWEKEQQKEPDSSKPKPSPEELASRLIEQMATFGAMDGDDLLKVRLSLPVAPTHTNGKWDPASKQVLWDTLLDSSSTPRGLPVYCYAVWSSPLIAAQVERFGRMILKDEPLLDYCLWHGTLSQAQAADWERMLKDFRPGVGFTNRLSSFRFAGESGEESKTAEAGVEILEKAISSQP